MSIRPDSRFRHNPGAKVMGRRDAHGTNRERPEIRRDADGMEQMDLSAGRNIPIPGRKICELRKTA